MIDQDILKNKDRRIYLALIKLLINASHDVYSYEEAVKMWARVIALDKKIDLKLESISASEGHIGEEEYPFYKIGYNSWIKPMFILGAINTIRQNRIDALHLVDAQAKDIIIEIASRKGKKTNRELHIKCFLSHIIYLENGSRSTYEIRQQIRKLSEVLHRTDLEKLDVIKQILRANPYLIVLVPDTHPVRKESVFIQELLRKNGKVLAFLDRQQRNDKAFVDLATSQNEEAWAYVGIERIDALFFHTPGFLDSDACEAAYLSLATEKKLQVGYIVQMLKSSRVNQIDFIKYLGSVVMGHGPTLRKVIFKGLNDKEIEKRIRYENQFALGVALLKSYLGTCLYIDG